MIEWTGLALIFALGLRHGLDPDHIAVIDNFVFRIVGVRPRTAPWTGSFFAIGHSLSVSVIAVGVSEAAERFALPAWTAPLIDAAVIGLLVLVGTLNLRALLRSEEYVPVAMRGGLVPRRLRASTHPLAILLIGVIFGLVFDTASQAAAWGAAAATKGGAAAALAIAGSFTLGMFISDTTDSQIVARLLLSTRRSGDMVRRYRRAVGWLVVALSYGMAAYALLGSLRLAIAVPESIFSALGLAVAIAVVVLLATARRLARTRPAPLPAPR